MNLRLKQLIAIICMLALCAGAYCHAQSYVDAASRINFYYQYEGGSRSEPGYWDGLLKDRLLSLYGHSTIVPYTDKYLTGRGCCLFAFSHAYQYLCGYAANDREKANILYNYLAVKPVWSNKGSSMSPPNAASYYASYLRKQSGVSLYGEKPNSFAKLVSFFEGGRGVLIVNAPGHYIIAVGAVKAGGKQYVQIVDSILAGTVRAGRISGAKSMDLKTTYTPDNALSYSPTVHEYLMSYDEFASKCKISYAFKSSTVHVTPPFAAEKDEIILPNGMSAQIKLVSCPDRLGFESLNPDVCAAGEDGSLTFVSEGIAEIRVYSLDNPLRELNVKVYCVDTSGIETMISPAGADAANPFNGKSLPAASSVTTLPKKAPGEDGVYDAMSVLYDSYGDEITKIEYLLISVSGEIIEIPSGVRLIETGAFEGCDFCFAALPQSVQKVEAGAFKNTPLKAVFVQNPDCAIAENAFGNDCGVLYDYEAYLEWKAR